MGITQLLFNLQSALLSRTDDVFMHSVEGQRAYLEKFPEPKDDMERGYYQYCCQAKLRGRLLNALISLAGFPVTLLLMLKYRKSAAPEKAEPCENRAVLFRDGKPANIVPTVLRDEFSQMVEDPIEGSYLRKEDLSYLWELIRRYPFSWQFILKCTVKIARYRYAMEKYAPKALIVCNEYSFTSSVLTEFCGRNQVELVNVMHGEKMYFMRDTFFHFHRCFVWDAFYADLFKRLRAEPNQFTVALPPSMVFTENNVEKSVDYTYYMGAEDGEALKRVVACLKQLAAKGNRVAIRPHPRYSNMEHVREQTDGTMILIEDTKAITIEHSLLRSRHAIAAFSTVLNQARYNGTRVVIDDVSNPEAFKKLNEVEYVMLNTEHTLLSAEVNQ